MIHSAFGRGVVSHFTKAKLGDDGPIFMILPPPASTMLGEYACCGVIISALGSVLGSASCGQLNLVILFLFTMTKNVMNEV